jgi:serine/threonine-protein kinase
MVEGTHGVLPTGHRFHGRYQIVRCLKAGGMGAVYEVLDGKTQRRRALKVMLPASIQDADLRARFRLEATITAGVESDHIVETFDADVDAETGSPFIVMELLKGEDLGAVLEQRGRLPAEEVLTLLGQLALALDKTHAAGIIHRDLKPENLFVTRADDGSPRLKVLDFGIAKMVQSGTDAKTTRVMGTPLYMPKEQITGDGSIGPAADLYATAHIAYTLLTGEPYWAHEARTATAQYMFLSMVLKGTREPATARAAQRGVMLPAAFDAWFSRATALEAELRFDRAATLVSALAQALAAPPSSISVPAAPVVTEPVPAVQAATPARSIQGSSMQAVTPTSAAVSRDQAATATTPKRWPWAVGVGGIALGAVALGAVKIAQPAGAPAAAASSVPADSDRVPLPSVSSVSLAPASASPPKPAEVAPPAASSTKPTSTTRPIVHPPHPTVTATTGTASNRPSALQRPAATTDDPTTER